MSIHYRRLARTSQFRKELTFGKVDAHDNVAIPGADHFTILERLQRADGVITKIALSLAAKAA
jgi:hypothetical protein